MVEEKKTKRERNIRSKLMAAIAMLLVSSIMMVSTTYAWFTLSTAPEVTGITTAVGANGNLEMALLPYKDGDVSYTTVADALNAITSGTGDSLLGDVERNVTWGNLVDLSDSSYALDKISLYPSKLNMIAGAEGVADKIADSYLSTPKYGSDGRITQLADNAIARLYENAVFGTENAYGVRAVGVSSGMSGREQAYRSALSAANAAAAKANTAAATSMAQGGTSLASIGMKKAQGTTTFSKDDLTQIRTALYALVAADTGALTYAETSMVQYLLAAAMVGATDESYPTVLSAFDSIKTLSDPALAGYIPDALRTQVTAITTLTSEVNGAIGEIDEMLKDATDSTTFTWDQISKFVYMLGDTDTMILCGQPLNYWLAKDPETKEFLHITELMSNVSNLVLVLKPGAKDNGVYIEMADIVGYFESEVTFNNLEYGGQNFSGLKARMQVNPMANPTYLASAKTVASTNATFGEGGSAISDFYGYIIDLAFRTNAADSNLMLQTDSIDRIYADSDVNANTMGGGSTMTFSMVGLQNFNVTQVANLMSYIRIVFFDPSSMSIYGEARLDFNKLTNQDGWELVLTNGEYEQEITVTENDATTTHIGYLGMNPETNVAEEVEVTEISMAMKMWDADANEGKGGWATDSKILSLVQNTATAVSALVYLDGEEITNADASTAGITGTMNIQFASSATLTPMEYGELRQPADEETTNEYKVKINGIDTGKTVREGQSLEFTIPTEYADYTVTKIMMGDTDITSSLVDGKLTIEKVTGDIEITAVDPNA